jgi:hypothetical protein
MTNEAGKEDAIKWWDNPAILAELEEEYKVWESGKEKGYGWAELKTEIAGLKQRKMRVNRKSTNQ